jgi:putative sensory transduction regulator
MRQSSLKSSVKLLCLLPVAALLYLPGLAHAQTNEQASQSIADSMTAEQIGAALEEAGFDVTMSEDRDSGHPVARGNIGNLVFIVRAMDCEGSPLACRQLLLFANFDLGRDITDQDFRIVNGFNDSAMDGRAYVLERTNQIGIDFIIDLSGGVSNNHIAHRLSRWEGVIATFIDQFSKAQTGS